MSETVAEVYPAPDTTFREIERLFDQLDGIDVEFQNRQERGTVARLTRND